ncbi:phospholipase A and acyltransferase 3-like [Stegostoma tigrinum]|uniref:phospholipase A and acyltransferase 3-like n=1 Tax=Stegostoma tigrinum TaxID=3053191 RepID=UPI002870919A|nr:phospholipase A and acyltransferase 3-like [Stegostoma tigrinum]
MAGNSGKGKAEPGDLLERDDGFAKHWGVCTDKGVVHLTPENDASKSKIMTEQTVRGTVSEVGFENFANGRSVTVHKTTTPPSETIERARAKIGAHDYNLTKYNCEHFAKEAAGMCQSGQVERVERVVKNVLDYTNQEQNFSG